MPKFKALQNLAVLAVVAVASLGLVSASPVGVEAAYGGNPCTTHPNLPKCQKPPVNIDINLGNIQTGVIIIIVNIGANIFIH